MVLRGTQNIQMRLRCSNSAIHIYFSEVIVGQHDQPIKCVEFSPNVNTVVTGSWDSTVKLWDPRTPCNAGSFTQPDKVRFQTITEYYTTALAHRLAFSIVLK